MEFPLLQHGTGDTNTRQVWDSWDLTPSQICKHAKRPKNDQASVRRGWAALVALGNSGYILSNKCVTRACGRTYICTYAYMHKNMFSYTVCIYFFFVSRAREGSLGRPGGGQGQEEARLVPKHPKTIRKSIKTTLESSPKAQSLLTVRFWQLNTFLSRRDLTSSKYFQISLSSSE